jgi:hypothetical protein
MIMEPSGHGMDDEVGMGETLATSDRTIAAVPADRTDLMLATLGVALAFLGPGAQSIDACLFGRKRLGI